MARLEEWKPTVCEEADGNAGLDRLQLASKRHLQGVSKSGLLKKFLVEEQNGISIKWDFLNFVIFIEQNGIPFVRDCTFRKVLAETEVVFRSAVKRSSALLKTRKPSPRIRFLVKALN